MEPLGSILDLVVREDRSEEAMVEDEEGKETWREHSQICRVDWTDLKGPIEEGSPRPVSKVGN